MVKIEVDAKGVIARIRDLPLAYRKAAARAVTDAMRQAQTQASKTIRDTYPVTATDIRKATRVIPANAKQPEPTAAIEASSRALQKGGRIPLIAFKAKQTRAGVTAQIRKGEPRRLYPGAFITTLKSGHRGVFRRVFGRGGIKQVLWFKGIGRHRGKTVYRTKTGAEVRADLPIAELMGQSVKNMYRDERVFHAVGNKVREVYERLFKHHLAFYQRRQG